MDAQRPLAESGDRGTTEIRRGALLKHVGIALGGIAAGGAAAAGFADASGGGSGNSGKHGDPALSAQDRDVLELALRLEHLQTAFYSEALRRGKLTGEVKQFAQIVGREEHQHLAYVGEALGHPSSKPTKYSFGDATAGDKQFVAAAAKLEDTGLAAYNGQAGNLSADTLRSIGRVISVEARHAAWARSLAGQLPAPDPVDAPISAAKALQAINGYAAGP